MYYVAILIFALLNLTDLFVTVTLIDQLGFEAEGNKLLYWSMISANNDWPLYLAKALNTTLMVWISLHCASNPKLRKILHISLWCVSALLLGAITMGLIIMRTL